MLIEIIITSVVALVVLVLIVGACQVFTNAIEWLGHRFNLSDSVVGSVLAAVGTALPETIVPIVALASGAFTGGLDPHVAQEIGIGGILGAPFLLSTLGMFVIASAAFFYGGVLKKRPLELHFHSEYLKRDLKAFFVAYALLISASFIPIEWLKKLVAVLLIALYAWYLWRVIKQEPIKDERESHHDVETELGPLYFQPLSLEPRTGLIIAQIAFSLIAIIILAHVFVEQINHFSEMFKISPLFLSLIITPIATEMPEKFNSFLWIGREKDNLALGNMTGAMVFQSTFPGMIGLLFTPWILNTTASLSIGLCMLASVILFFFATRFGPKMTPYVCLGCGLLYFVFLGLVLTGVVHN